MESAPTRTESPTVSIDDVLTKLEKMRQYKSSSANATPFDRHNSNSKMPNCKSSRQDSETMEREDTKNQTRRLPTITRPTTPFGLAEQQKETDKLRNFSVQLRMMQARQRCHTKKGNEVVTTATTTAAPSPRIAEVESRDSTNAQVCFNSSGESSAPFIGTIDTAASTCRASNCGLKGSPSVGTAASRGTDSDALSEHELLVAQALRMASAATLLQSNLRGSMHRIKMVRALKEREEMGRAATQIASAWRMFDARKNFVGIVRDAIICQTVARRYFATKKAAALRHELLMHAAAVKCQASIRMWLALRRFDFLSQEVSSALSRYYNGMASNHTTLVDVTLCQPLKKLQNQLDAVKTIQSKWSVFASEKCEFKTKEERLMEAKATTAISAAWRRYRCQALYKRTIRDVITVQSIVRSNAAVKEVETKWNEYRMDCASILVQANWRSFAAAKEYNRIRSGIIAIQAVARMQIASRRWKTLRSEILCAFKRWKSQGEYTLTAEDVAVCQSVILNISIEKVKFMKSQDDTAASPANPSTLEKVNPIKSEDTAETTKSSALGDAPSDHTPSKLTVVTSNEISKLCNQILADPDVETPHDFAMIYMSMISPEADVEAIYLSPRLEEGQCCW